ncbi:methyltransferase, partial [Mycobacterium avium 09-5983]
MIFASILVDGVGVPGWQRLARADTSWLDADDELGRRTLATSRDFVAACTVHFDQYFADAIAAGICQVVILASGLDA